jgi:hypothetical protein
MTYILDCFIYFSAAGRPLRRKWKYVGKHYEWEHFNSATCQWVRGAPDKTATSTLYKLEAIAKDRPEVVVVCEGEKDVKNTIKKLGLPSVTSGQAGSWESHHSQQLFDHGCRFALISPHHDLVGMKSAQQVARHNLSLGIQSKIIELPGLAESEDISDWIERGGTQSQFLRLAETVAWMTNADLPVEEVKQPRRQLDTNYKYDPRLNAYFFETLKLPTTSRGRVKALCPFHVDSDPSLSIDLDRGLWFCHSCAEGDTVTAFYQKMTLKKGHLITRTEAWRRLKTKYLMKGNNQ